MKNTKSRLIFALIVLSLSFVLVLTSFVNSLNEETLNKVHVKNSISSNWAGYAVQTNLSNPQNYSVTYVKGSWIVPSVTCEPSETSYAAIWVGIDGHTSDTVEQIGTDSDCISGKPVYRAWFEMYPKAAVNIKSLKVSPGDRINAEVRYLGRDTFEMTIVDVTKGTKYSTTRKAPEALRSSAEWIVEAPSLDGFGVFPLANFGNVTFENTQVTINGVTGTIDNPLWQNDPITMQFAGTVEAQPSALSVCANGNSMFTITWYHF